ncbi:hypothetical protein IGI04_024360 [Brassica rapa subsp. trilocularis]|uniref:Uncharacterized protein n=1 Tax=Brassica rapa subsp. trilocularis TaxID=1813537 RepID=A0ABQ7M6H2_BRACM|nr:hypothetical protein IGI04_024360 [Brassica rapa subsp. trilocularis]
MSLVNSSFAKHEFKANSLITRHKFEINSPKPDRLHLSQRTWGDLLLGMDLHPLQGPLDIELGPYC